VCVNIRMCIHFSNFFLSTIQTQDTTSCCCKRMNWRSFRFNYEVEILILGRIKTALGHTKNGATSLCLCYVFVEFVSFASRWILESRLSGLFLFLPLAFRPRNGRLSLRVDRFPISIVRAPSLPPHPREQHWRFSVRKPSSQ